MKMKIIKVTGTKWYTDIEFEDKIARFYGELCSDGFYVDINSLTWIKHTGFTYSGELAEIIEEIKRHNKESKFKIYFDDDSSKK